jgi:hypothetical protein
MLKEIPDLRASEGEKSKRNDNAETLRFAEKARRKKEKSRNLPQRRRERREEEGRR